MQDPGYFHVLICVFVFENFVLKVGIHYVIKSLQDIVAFFALLLDGID